MTMISVEFSYLERLIRENERLLHHEERARDNLAQAQHELFLAQREIANLKRTQAPDLKDLLRLCQNAQGDTYDTLCNLFRQEIEKVDANLIPRIRRVREITGLGLKDAKNFVEGENNLRQADPVQRDESQHVSHAMEPLAHYEEDIPF